jgi:hypothetical protein
MYSTTLAWLLTFSKGDYGQETPRGYHRDASVGAHSRPEVLGESHDLQEVEDDDDIPIHAHARRSRPRSGPNMNNPYRGE